MFSPSLTTLLTFASLLLSLTSVDAGSLRSRDLARTHKGIAERNAFNPFHSPEWQQVADSVGKEKRKVKTGGKQKRKVKKRACAASTSTTVATSATPTVQSSVVSTASISTTLIVQNNPATSGFLSTVSSAAPSSSTVTPAPVPSSTSTSAAVASSSTAVSTAPITVDPEGNGPFNGESTYYILGTTGTAIGACGNYLVDSDKIAAASEYLFDSWPGATGNPNTNPICGLYAKVHYQGKSVVVRIEDRCPGCAKRHLDLSPSAFSELAPFSVGMMDVTWEWVSGPNA